MYISRKTEKPEKSNSKTVATACASAAAAQWDQQRARAPGRGHRCPEKGADRCGATGTAATSPGRGSVSGVPSEPEWGRTARETRRSGIGTGVETGAGNRTSEVGKDCGASREEHRRGARCGRPARGRHRGEAVPALAHERGAEARGEERVLRVQLTLTRVQAERLTLIDRAFAQAMRDAALNQGGEAQVRPCRAHALSGFQPTGL
ncbi:hypothetical protein FB451DRAFT_1467969 [Mycena latifolia]|nr:hypothetical protein FB451DRAFT_1467969 [Mycena latifolia]